MEYQFITKLQSDEALLPLPSGAIRLLNCLLIREEDARIISNLIGEYRDLRTQFLECATIHSDGTGRFKSVVDAVTLFGSRNASAIALILSLMETLKRQDNSTINHNRFWVRSLLAAIYGRSAFTAVSGTDTEEVFAASLLQDIGMFSIVKLKPSLYENLHYFTDYHAACVEAESSNLSISHANASYWLLSNWGINPVIANAVAKSHYPYTPLKKGPFSTLDKCVVLSGMLADIWLNNAWAQRFTEALSFSRLWLNLTPEQFVDVFSDHCQCIYQYQKIFGLTLIDEPKSDKILSMVSHLVGNR